MSNAVERPVWPCSSRYRKRSLVSSAVPNPANCRIVHNRPRYMLGYTPRVNGNSPGNPILASTSPGRSASVYNARIGSPDSVVNETSRSVRCLSSVAMRVILGSGRYGLIGAHRLAEQRAGDHEPLDLARSLVDLGDLRVAVVALDRELLRIPVAAEDLDRLAGLPPGRLRREELRLRALLRVRPPLLPQPG